MGGNLPRQAVPPPSVLVLPPLLQSPSNCKNTFRIQFKMLNVHPCKPSTASAKAMNTRITKSYIFCGSLKSGPSHRTKWKKMENLYPFLLRLARKVQFKRRKTENVCRPHCTLKHLIFQHSSSCAESVTCIYNEPENCPSFHFGFDSSKVLILSWMLWASHHLVMCVFTLAT